MRRIFWGFCRNWVLIDSLHYLSSRSAFGFEFAEIFVIEKRLPDSVIRQVGDSPTRQVGESLTLRVGESPWWVGESNFLKFSIDFRDFKRLNQPFKRSIWQKRSQGCDVLLPLIYLKCWKFFIYRHSCRLPDSASRGVVFRLQIYPRIRSPNWNGSKCSVRNLRRTDFCKNPRKSASLPCPFNNVPAGLWIRQPYSVVLHMSQ